MFPKRAGDHRRRRLLLPITCALLSLVLLVGWLAFPWYRINDLRVENAQIVASTLPDRGGQVDGRAIAVTYSTERDLADLRADIDIGYIAANMFTCDATAGDNREVVVQRAEYLSDRRRVRALGVTSSGPERRHRYLVVFDDELTHQKDGRLEVVPATRYRDNLCFALDGASMWAGKLWSNHVKLKLLQGRK
ncbi:hypothetical protein [Sphingomonas sp.]|uniref:hypothetical protein n=1 Tax=Sphingomonas sp. TaxID=28214 RepID=UPI003AFF8880